MRDESVTSKDEPVTMSLLARSMSIAACIKL